MTSRPRLSLDGPWMFWTDAAASLSSDTLQAEQAAIISVPAPIQSQFDDLRYFSGAAWYRRTLEVPADWSGARTILHFGAVDYFASVWVNDTHVGEHEGGYLPFEFDVTDALQEGENHLTVRIDDPAALFREIPHGKQSWYGPLSGIWQSVWLESRATLHTQAVRVLPDLQTGRVDARVAFSATAGEGYGVTLTIRDGEGQEVATRTVGLSMGADGAKTELEVQSPRSWSPDGPNLYQLEVTVTQNGEAQDTFTETFGFRTIEARDGKLYLNGELLYLRAALDQDYYPDTISTTPSVEFLEDQFRKAKELGLNCLRCHIKVADPRYYEAADRMGLLIWTELPNWATMTENAAKRGKETLEGLVERDWNHPSIIIWTVINEGWGLDLMNDPTHRAWMKEMYHWLKKLDPTRLVVDNSPCVGNFHVESDLEDYHYYQNIPDHRRQWDTFVNAFASRLAPTYSPFGDAVRTGKEPLIVSEYGNWGLPDPDLLLDENGREPWWFETGMEWGSGIMYPHAIKERFYRYHLDKVFGTWKAFIEAAQWQQFYALKYEIERMRRHPEIVGHVITEFTDAHWECNGLLDMRRNPRIFHDQFATINADTVVIPRWHQVSHWSGDAVKVGLALSHAAGKTLPESEVQWWVDEGVSGNVLAPQVEAGSVQKLEAATFVAPTVTEPTLQKLNFQVQADDGTTLATNHLWLSIYPERNPAINQNLPIWTAHPSLQRVLHALGYPIVRTVQDAKVMIVDEMTSTVTDFIRDGGHVLLLADSPNALGRNGFLGMEMTVRKGTLLQGDWASSFAWVRRQGPFARLPGGPLLDHSFDAVIPNYVLLGFNQNDFEVDVHAGLFVGWIHKIGALIGERRYGKGKIVVSTFRFSDAALGVDPTATTLLDALIELTTMD